MNDLHSRTLGHKLTSNEVKLTRRCNACKSPMKTTQRENETWNGPGAERGIRFACSNCNSEIWIADRTTIVAALFSSLGIISIISYAVFNNAIGFINHALFTEQSLISVLIGCTIGLLILLFACGSALLLKGSLHMLHNRYRHPLIAKDSGSSQIRLILLLGLLPWLVAIGAGLLNDEYFNLGEGLVLIVLPVLVAPIYFAPKLGVAWTSVFMAAAFWLAAGSLGIWLIDG